LENPASFNTSRKFTYIQDLTPNQRTGPLAAVEGKIAKAGALTATGGPHTFTLPLSRDAVLYLKAAGRPRS
jgi:hypothetical protein